MLTKRKGPRPRTILEAPHSQLDQLLPAAERRAMSEALVAALADLGHISLAPSRRAPPGTIGFYLDPDHACGDPRAFLLGREIAHVHVEDDGSLHAILPEPLRSEAIAQGWAEPHPFAGMPTVSPDTVMLYAPRDAAEMGVVVALLKATRQNAMRG